MSPGDDYIAALAAEAEELYRALVDDDEEHPEDARRVAFKHIAERVLEENQ